MKNETICAAWLFLGKHDESVQRFGSPGIDWKALGYLISILSVFLLGAIAWPKPDKPGWNLALLIAGMAASIAGMGCRYKAHLDQKRELKRTEANADGALP